MKKEKRIKSTLEFQEIMQKKNFRNNGSFTVYIRERKEEEARFGISVPKRLANAVVRNKTRRQIRNMLQAMGNESYDFDAIILVRKGYFVKSYEDNQKDLEKLLKTFKI